MKILVKPLSVNRCRKGTRYKTNEYKSYEKSMNFLLPKIDLSRYNQLEIKLIFYFSTKLSDIDWPIKPTLDILQKKRNFNDNRIYSLIVTKQIVSKWNEWIGIEVWEIIE